MSSYRGVTQADLVRSITDAIEMLEKHSTGPAMQGYIDGLKKPDANGVSKLSAIAAAADDVSLVNAVNASGVSYLFARGYEVMQYHALNNTDKKGRAVFRDLNSWGAMSGAMTMEFNKYDAEFQKYLKSHKLRASFNKVVGVFTGATKEVLLPQEQPLQRYGVAIDALTTGLVKHTDPAIKAIRNDVEQALSPFYELDEVNMTGIGIILWPSKKGDPIGVVFNASARAAAAVAAAVPDLPVLNSKGERINPPAPKPQAQPKP